MAPTPGRIVHFRIPDSEEYGGGRWRPALVLAVGAANLILRVHLLVGECAAGWMSTYKWGRGAMMDHVGADDLQVAGAQEGTEVGQWRWPPREGG